MLTAVLVAGIGFIGVATLSPTNLRTTLQGQVYSQATILADELADTMSANLSGYEGDQFSSHPEESGKDCMDNHNCTTQEQAQFDVEKWLASTACVLPLDDSGQ